MSLWRAADQIGNLSEKFWKLLGKVCVNAIQMENVSVYLLEVCFRVVKRRLRFVTDCDRVMPPGTKGCVQRPDLPRGPNSPGAELHPFCGKKFNAVRSFKENLMNSSCLVACRHWWVPGWNPPVPLQPDLWEHTGKLPLRVSPRVPLPGAWTTLRG